MRSGNAAVSEEKCCYIYIIFYFIFFWLSGGAAAMGSGALWLCLQEAWAVVWAAAEDPPCALGTLLLGRGCTQLNFL